MTLNQFVKIVQRLGEDHKIIRTTWNGAVMDKLAEVDVEYPVFTFDITGARIDGQVIVYDLSMFFFDRLQIDAENEREVQSDQLQIAQDIIAQLRYPGWEDFVILNNVPITFFSDNTPELLAGVNARASIQMDFASDRCVVPTTFTYAT
jgi:hypothetical protein